MEQIKFSVSMCVYGGDNAEWFKIAVDSILNQTLPPSEVVLVVDGPVPEELMSIIKYYKKNTIFKIIFLANNQGHGNARRLGLKNCTYELVALMDADDISQPYRFERQIMAFRNNPSLSIIGGQVTEFCNNPEYFISKRFVPLSDSDIKNYMKKRCPMNQPTVMFKKNDIEDVGGYIDWYCNEDYYLWIRLALAKKKFENLDMVLVNMRTTKSSFQRRGGMKYFKSERKIQKLMLDNQLISNRLYISNVLKRFVLQVLMTNKLRGFVVRKMAREV